MKLKIFLAAVLLGFWVNTVIGQTVEIDRNPLTISPGAEVGSKIRIKWKVFKETSVVVQVADKNGKVLKTIDAGKMPPGIYSVIYDGKDAEGKILPAGNYTLRFVINPKVEPDISFGNAGMLGKITKIFTYQKDRVFSMGIKDIAVKTVTVKVDGETWEREEDFSLAGKNFVVDGPNGLIKLNPQADIPENAEVEVSYCVGLPLENPWALETAPDGSLYIVDNLRRLDLAMKNPKPRTGMVFKVDSSGNPVPDFGSAGVLEFSAEDIAVDREGNIYLLSIHNHVEVYDGKGMKKMNVAGFLEPHRKGGYLNKDPNITGQPEGCYWPVGIGLNKDKRMVIINLNQTFVLYDATKPDFQGFIALGFTHEPPVYCQGYGPCVAAWGDSFYQTTCRHNLIKYQFDPESKTFATVWQTPNKGASTPQKPSPPPNLWHAMGVKVDGTGLIYVANRNNNRVEVFFDAGNDYKYVTSLGSKGTDLSKCQMMAPHALALSPDGKSLYVADDGFFFKHLDEPVVKGLDRVIKMKLTADEFIEIPLTVK